MKENLVKIKSFDFAILVVDLCKALMNNQNEYIMSKQLLKSGTSIGANVREGEFAESKADFIHKMSISLKEANETEYWLDLLYRTNYLSVEVYKAIKEKVVELLRLLISIVKTSKAKNNY